MKPWKIQGQKNAMIRIEHKKSFSFNYKISKVIWNM